MVIVMFIFGFLSYALVGSVLGMLIEKIPSPNGRKLAVALIIVALFAAAAAVTWGAQKQTDVYQRVGYTVQDCIDKEPDEHSKITCIDIVYRRFAPDPATCLLLSSNDSLLRMCTEYVASEAKDASVCNAFNESQQAKDYCLSFIPKDAGNVADCELIKSEMQRYQCYNSAAWAARDFALCSKMPFNNPYEPAPNKQWCIKWLAQNAFFDCTGDAACIAVICDSIVDPEAKGVCTWTLSELQK